jgi:hypothetical protein
VVGYTITSDTGDLNLQSMIIPGTNVYLSDVVKKIELKPQVKYYKHLDGTLVINIQAFKQPDVTL